MANAVENASIIMPFLCRDYERSENCEKELSYADAKNKSIIPILIEPNYKPSGWLALVISRFKYIDISHTGGQELFDCIISWSNSPPSNYFFIACKIQNKKTREKKLLIK